MMRLQTYVYSALFLILILIVCISSGQSNTLYVLSDEGITVDEIFYWNLPNRGPVETIEGIVIESNPFNACRPILPPPFPVNSTLKWFVLIRMYECPVEFKLRMAENAGFDAVIAYPYIEDKNHLPSKRITSDVYDSNVTIVGIRVSQNDGEKIKDRYQYTSRYYLRMFPDEPFNIFRYIIPFVIAVGICMLILMLFVIVKYIRERRRNQRNRLSSRHLKKLPIIKFKKGDQYDVCAICLEEYNEGNKLRVLPCSHAYHTKCIDPWLTNNRRTCPICKRKIRLDDESSDSESDSESEAPTETTPLLRSLAGRIAASRQRALNTNFLRNPVINSNQSDVTENGSRNDSESNQTAYRVRPTLEQQAGSFLQHLVHIEPHTGESDNSSAYSSSAPPFLIPKITEDDEHGIYNQPSTSAEQTSSLPNIAPSTSSIDVTVENQGKKTLKDMIV